MVWDSTLAALYFRCQDLHCYNVHADLTEKHSQAQNDIFLACPREFARVEAVCQQKA